MQLARYVDGRPLNYDEATVQFDVGGAVVTPEAVIAYDRAGQLSWSNPDFRTKMYAYVESLQAHASPQAAAGPVAVAPVVTPAQQPAAQRRRPSKAVIISVAIAASLAAALAVFGALAVLASPAGTASSAPAAQQPSVAATATPATEASPAAAPAPKPISVTKAVGVTTIPATVARHTDGDTAVFVLEDGTSEKVRFIGIDTPESTKEIEPYGEQAAAYTARAIPVGTKVYLEKGLEQRDRYGRLLAYVWLEQPTAVTDAEIRSKMLNARIAIRGYATQMTIQPNSKYADHFRRYVAEARASDRGLWGLSASGGSAQEAPAAAPAPSSASYIGNKNTMRFHIPSCASVTQMNPANQVALASRAEAISGGYVPCGNCKP